MNICILVQIYNLIKRRKMLKKFCLLVSLCVFLVVSGCLKKGIIISGVSATFGGADISDASGTTIISGIPSGLKYTMTLTNIEYYDLTVVSSTPVLSDSFANKVFNKNITVDVNKTISKGESIDVSGEIIFNEEELKKEEINHLIPMVKEFKIVEERTLGEKRIIRKEKTIRHSF